MEKGICNYCTKYKQAKVWKETGELVCYECRESLLEQEFKDAGFDWTAELKDMQQAQNVCERCGKPATELRILDYEDCNGVAFISVCPACYEPLTGTGDTQKASV